MVEIVEKSKCVGCGACKTICSKNAIKMKADDSTGFLYPLVDNELCVDCGLCKKACPVLKENEKNGVKQTFAAYALDENIRENSSSGGIFSLLAENVLSENGVVLGVSMSRDCSRAEHILVEKKEELEKLRGSKYIQSDVNDSYKLAKQNLDEGKKVLFSGTPCQVAGFKSYLGKDYDNLITVDFICHGVPSPLAWEKYLKFREEKAVSQTRRTFFRHKKPGWKPYSVKFEFSNSTEYTQVLTRDLYMRGFISDLFLRPSCFECEFKDSRYQSDITLADFWGIEKIKPEWNDNKGVSLVVTNTDKGNLLLENIKEVTERENVEFKDAFVDNPSYFKSVEKKFIEKLVFKDLNKLSFDKFIEKYVGNSFKAKLLRKIHRIFVKITS